MPDVTPEDALQVAQRALAKVNGLEQELEKLRTERDDLAEDLAAVQLRLSEMDEDRSYESLSVEEKVGMVREHAFERARDGHGRAKLDYDDIKWEIFDGKPGNNTCYRLIRLAAGLEDDEKTGSNVRGFTARDPGGENYHLAVDAEKAKRGVAFSGGIKQTTEVGN